MAPARSLIRWALPGLFAGLACMAQAAAPVQPPPTWRVVLIRGWDSLYPINVNFQVVPGYDYGLRVTPNASGDFRIMCNEFCGIGHHVMVGRVIVQDAPVSTTASGAAQ